MAKAGRVELKDIPNGSKVFIDANIFLYPALNDPRYRDSCKAFLERVSKGEVQGFASVLVLNEVLHKLMVSETANKHNLRGGEATSYLKQNPDEIKQLTQVWKDMDHIKILPNLTVLDVPIDLFWKGVEHSNTFGLMAMDGAHIAVMEAHGLTDLASNDSHFQRVPWIKLYQP